MLIVSALLIGTYTTGIAKKTGYKLKTEKSDTKQEEMVRGSFMVASQCDDCNNGYHLSQITFSGFDKPQQSNRETFFITNNTDRTMTGVVLYIEYLTPDGRQLNKSFYRLSCNIPAGETRIAEIPTWDKQNSFYYEKSKKSRSGGTPFTVVFDPVSFYLRF